MKVDLPKLSWKSVTGSLEFIDFHGRNLPPKSITHFSNQSKTHFLNRESRERKDTKLNLKDSDFGRWL
jgi:hypothetical protein